MAVKNSRYKTAEVLGMPERGEITCEIYGYAINTTPIFWLESTKETFTYAYDCFVPYDGPIVHGTGYSF